MSPAAGTEAQAPLALQLVGYIGHEEVVLAALKKVVEAIQL